MYNTREIADAIVANSKRLRESVENEAGAVPTTGMDNADALATVVAVSLAKRGLRHDVEYVKSLVETETSKVTPVGERFIESFKGTEDLTAHMMAAFSMNNHDFTVWLSAVSVVEQAYHAVYSNPQVKAEAENLLTRAGSIVNLVASSDQE